MKKLTLEEFGDLMHNAINRSHNSNERLGQAIFNTTHFLFPELADNLRNTGADCFHQDSKIIHFVNAILES